MLFDFAIISINVKKAYRAYFNTNSIKATKCEEYLSILWGWENKHKLRIPKIQSEIAAWIIKLFLKDLELNNNAL